MIKFLEYFTRALAWLQIAISPTLAGCIAGFFVWHSDPGLKRHVLAIAIAALGVIVGVTWATRVWIKGNTVDFMSKVIASPELNNPEPVNEEKKDTEKKAAKKKQKKH